jgi:hypothetical protein
MAVVDELNTHYSEVGLLIRKGHTNASTAEVWRHFPRLMLD